MRDLIRGLEQKVKDVRQAGETGAIITTANFVIAELEAAAQTSPDISEADRLLLLNAAKNVAYNCAADIWPGWETRTAVRSGAELQSGQGLAEKCRALTDQLSPSDMQQGNAIWLIGAFELARGNFHKAIHDFSEAATAFAGEREAKLMAQGFWAIASDLAGETKTEETPDFNKVIAGLNEIATEDAGFMKAQLRTAKTIFLDRA